MTQKDCAVIAEALRRAQAGTVSVKEWEGVYRAVLYVTAALAHENPQFDKEEFFRAVYPLAFKDSWVERALDRVKSLESTM